jgi:methyl-accepting chemotaxis protein
MDRRQEERRRDDEAVAPEDAEQRIAERRTGPKTRRGMNGLWNRFIVPGGFHTKATLVVAGAGLIVIAVGDFALYMVQKADHERMMAIAPDLAARIQSQDQAQLAFLLLASAVALLVISAMILIESHKAAGPLYNLQKVMKRIAEDGTPGRAQFRRGDYFQELGDAFNAMIAGLERRAKTRAETAGHVAVTLHEVAGQLGNGAPDVRAASSRLAVLAGEVEGLGSGTSRL